MTLPPMKNSQANHHSPLFLLGANAFWLVHLMLSMLPMPPFHQLDGRLVADVVVDVVAVVGNGVGRLFCLTFLQNKSRSLLPNNDQLDLYVDVGVGVLVEEELIYQPSQRYPFPIQLSPRCPMTPFQLSQICQIPFQLSPR